MKKLAIMLLTGAMSLGLASCANSTITSSSPSQSNQNNSEKNPYIGNTYSQQPDIREYTYSWWPEGTGTASSNKFFVQTGHYGISINGTNGMINRLGAIKEEYGQSEVMSQDASVINSLPEIDTFSSAIINDTEYLFTDTIQPAQYNTINMRIIESGQYMQSFDTAAMIFADASSGKQTNDFIGRTEIKALPRYFALNFQLFAQQNFSNVTLKYSFEFNEEMEGAPSQNGREIILTSPNGCGLTVMLPDEKASLSYDQASRTLTMTCTDIALKQFEFGGFGAIIIPSASPSQADIDNYNAIASLNISAYQLAPREGREVPVEFDADRGIWIMNTNRMTSAKGTAFASEQNQNASDRVQFTLENTSDQTITVPVMFEKSGTFAVEGFGPVIRDVDTGEPLGVPIQISKNWHPYASTISDSEWYKGLDGSWFHGYTYLEVPANSSVTYEYMNAFNNWGTINVASHAQLCLIGWPAYSSHQIWHTSTIGSSGEAFCYDPDQTCGLSFINDVRGVGFDPYDNGQEYVWGTNNGGGNFLYYGKDGSNTSGIVGFKNVRVFYRNYAPNLAEVIFTGLTKDNAVEFTITTYLGRTNDVSRATHTFEYTFLKDVSFERMAFYQLGADNHNSGRWHGLTIGNNDGPIEYTIDGVTYGAEAELPVYDTAGYIGNNGMQRIEVPGEGMWIAFTNSYTKINSDYFDAKTANRMLSLLSFEANLNGKTYTKPAFNIRSTEMFCGNSTLVELCPPAETGSTIKAGSTVKGAVEYINLPISLSSFYYDSPIVKSIPEEEFNTWRMAYRYAMGDKTQASAQTGEIIRQYPIAVKCADALDVLAEITIKGGISYIPITFTNVPSYSGYRLETLTDGQWTKIDQSYLGNDYWQACYNAETGSYELTFNVEHSGDPEAEYSYRLVKE